MIHSVADGFKIKLPHGRPSKLKESYGYLDNQGDVQDMFMETSVNTDNEFMLCSSPKNSNDSEDVNHTAGDTGVVIQLQSFQTYIRSIFERYG